MGYPVMTFDGDKQCFILKDKVIEKRIQKIAKKICKSLDVTKAEIKYTISVEITK